MTDSAQTSHNILQYVYYNPHTLRVASDLDHLTTLITSDEAGLASSVDSFVRAREDANLKVDTDFVVLPLVDDKSIATINRRQFRLFEIVSDIENAYSSPIQKLTKPDNGDGNGNAVLRISPALRTIRTGLDLVFNRSDLVFAKNFAEGTRLVVETPWIGRITLTVQEITVSESDVRARVQNWPTGPRVPSDGAEVVVVGVAVSDPAHVCVVSELHNWRLRVTYSNQGDNTGVNEYDVAQDVNAILGDAVAKGSVAVSGSEASGVVYVAVEDVGSDKRGTTVVQVIFGSPYASAPVVSLAPANANAACLVPQPYVNVSTSGLAIALASPEGRLSPATVYAWSFDAKANKLPQDRRPVSLADFNEGLYRLLYTPADRSLAGKTTEAVFDDYLLHPERIACERDMAKITDRAFDVTIARTAMAMAKGAVLTFQGPRGGAVSGLAGANDVDAGASDSIDAFEADRLVPTLAAVKRLMQG